MMTEPMKRVEKKASRMILENGGEPALDMANDNRHSAPNKGERIFWNNVVRRIADIRGCEYPH